MTRKTVLLELLALILLLPATVACAAVECEYSEIETQAVPGHETQEELVARLEQELQDRLNRFEQCVESTESDAAASSSSAAGGGEASSSLAGSEPVQVPLPEGSAQESASAQAEALAEGLASMETADSVEAGASREGDNTNGPPVPADIPPGTDDDVVAAQLREAAQASGSEDLWNEYRRYKGLPTE